LFVVINMSGLSSCNSWKELKKPQNPFFGAMFSRSHRKRKRKRVLQPINNPSERGRSMEPPKDPLESTGIRSISLENQKILPKASNEVDEKFMSTDSSIEMKRPPKPQRFLEKNKPIVASNTKIIPKVQIRDKSAESSLEKYSFIDEALMNNTISMRKKYVKPANVEESKVMQGRPSRKYVKSPRKLDFLPFAPDLKPTSINSFQLGITRMEFQLSNFFENTEKGSGCLEELMKKNNCKLMIKGG